MLQITEDAEDTEDTHCRVYQQGEVL